MYRLSNALKENRKKVVDTLLSRAPKDHIWNSDIDMTRAQFNPSKKDSRIQRPANQLILASAAASNGYRDPRWMTYEDAQVQGFQVKQGEKATFVEEWKQEPLYTYDRNADTSVKRDEKGKPVLIPVTDENNKPVTAYVGTAVPYYNAEQIVGIPAYEKPHGLSYEKRQELLDQLIKNSKAPIVFDSFRRCYYNVKEDVIHLPERFKTVANKILHKDSPVEEMSTKEELYAAAIYGIVKSTGHKDRLFRNLRAEPDALAKEALVQDLAATKLAQRYDVSLHEFLRDNSLSKYDKNWQPYIKEKPFALFAAAKAASDAVKYIEEHMLTKEQRNDKFLRAEDVRNNPELIKRDANGKELPPDLHRGVYENPVVINKQKKQEPVVKQELTAKEKIAEAKRQQEVIKTFDARKDQTYKIHQAKTQQRQHDRSHERGARVQHQA